MLALGLAGQSGWSRAGYGPANDGLEKPGVAKEGSSARSCKEDCRVAGYGVPGTPFGLVCA